MSGEGLIAEPRAVHASVGHARLKELMHRGTEFLGCKVAILGGAMSWVSERSLVSAISNAGGFGVIACGAMSPELLDTEIAETKARTDRPFGVNLITMHPQLSELIDTCAKHHVGHVVLAGGLPPGGAIDRIRRYPLAELRIARRIGYEVEANWKVILENYNECYHCGGVHPELCKVVPAFKQKGGMDLDWERGVPHREGAWTFTMSGTTNRKPFAGLNEDEQTRHKGELLYPNFMLSLSAEHAAAFTLWPTSPSHTTILCDFLFHPSEIAQSDFNPNDAVEFWDITNRQDWVICESVQRGMASRVFRQGFYAPMESMSLDIRRYIRERLE